jgi:hypothetical protein
VTTGAAGTINPVLRFIDEKTDFVTIRWRSLNRRVCRFVPMTVKMNTSLPRGVGGYMQDVIPAVERAGSARPMPTCDPEPISRLSPEAVIELIESNLVEASLTLGRSLDGVCFRGSDVVWVYTGVKSLSRVLKPRFLPDQAEDRVDEISACFRQWDATVSWVVGPTAWPPNLGEILSASGYGNSEKWIGMAGGLTQWVCSPEPITGFRVERVSDSRGLAAWAGLGETPVAPFEGEQGGAVEIFSPENAGGDARCRYYLGYLNGKPAVRGMTFVRGETVGIHWVDTLLPCNDMGCDRLLMARALGDAIAGGATTAVAVVPDAARWILGELGLKPYCQFRVYSWPPEPIRMPVH